ncbi:MAG: hypothetical protein ACI9XO_001372 [Paraglaciecola sp.]|jgi:hypothetical protein
MSPKNWASLSCSQFFFKIERLVNTLIDFKGKMGLSRWWSYFFTVIKTVERGNGFILKF